MRRNGGGGEYGEEGRVKVDGEGERDGGGDRREVDGGVAHYPSFALHTISQVSSYD